LKTDRQLSISPMFPELGMEAIWKVEVEDFRAFILVDDKGNDFFETVGPGCAPLT